MESKKLNRLRVVIAEKNLSNKWLSEQLGVGQATISKWVTNTSQPNLEMLIKISKLLEIDVNELIRFDEVVVEKKAVTNKE
jgi:DNA-binding Xre family transcriptional regulator